MLWGDPPGPELGPLALAIETDNWNEEMLQRSTIVDGDEKLQETIEREKTSRELLQKLDARHGGPGVGEGAAG